MNRAKKHYLLNYIIGLQSKGQYSFSLDDLRKSFPNSPYNTLKKALWRLITSKKLAGVRKGFFVIVPPEYLNSGILPPILFIDDMMKFINRRYYVGMLNSAVLHGASHQQPQDLFVITERPAMRDIKKAGIRIRFLIRKDFFSEGIIEQKTDTGYVKISSPELTAFDLIQFQKQAGGLNRVASIINEMIDSMDAEKLKRIAVNKHIPCSAAQRLGYVLENAVSNKELADKLFNAVTKRIKRRIALNPSKKIKGYPANNRWKIIVNTKLEIEE